MNKIINKNNNGYKCEIIKEEINNTFNLKFIKLNIDGDTSNSFNNENLNGKKIIININSLLNKYINNRPYFFVKIYQYLDGENGDKKFGKLLPNLNQINKFQIENSEENPANIDGLEILNLKMEKFIVLIVIVIIRHHISSNR